MVRSQIWAHKFGLYVWDWSLDLCARLAHNAWELVGILLHWVADPEVPKSVWGGGGGDTVLDQLLIAESN